MDTIWPDIAAHIVQSLGIQAGELVQVRDNAGRFDVLAEVASAIELRGATPLVQLVTPELMGRMLNQAPLDYLAHWDRHRAGWVAQTDRVLVLAGSEPGFDGVHRLTTLEEAHGCPTPLVTIPTESRARELGLSLEALEAVVLPALQVDARTLRAEIDRALALAEGGRMITVRSGQGCVLHAAELRLQRGDRPWRSDADAFNLPAGSIYTTVLEDKTEGSLWLPKAAGATGVMLHFEGGRVARIEAESGAEDLEALFDAHSGEPRRVSHIGVGLNPALSRPIGWTLVDEHIRGAFFIALGENRYMGGQNASSLNVDFCNPEATVEIDGRVLVSEGEVAV